MSNKTPPTNKKDDEDEKNNNSDKNKDDIKNIPRRRRRRTRIINKPVLNNENKKDDENKDDKESNKNENKKDDENKENKGDDQSNKDENSENITLSKNENNENKDNDNIKLNITNEKNDNETDIKIITDKLNMTIKKIITDMEKNKKVDKDRIKDRLSGFVDSLDNNENLKNQQLIKYENTNKTNKGSLEDFLNEITKKANENPGTKTTIFRFSSKDDFNLSDLFPSRRRSMAFSSNTPPGLPPIKLPPIRPPPNIKREKVNIEVEIENIHDLIQLTKDYPLKMDIEYNINMQALHDIKEPLTDLNNMIGMDKLKNSVVDQILYFIQDFHRISNAKNQDFMHTVIYGPPGTGKTEIAKIMGRIFSNMGVLSRKYFKKATRADLIAGYLGQTALKTRDVIKECIGGVLFIDEAYALGNPEKRDSFAKECIDTLCEGLSDHKDNLMVIIAGYESELKNCFFAYNQGLDSRFTWRFNTDDYTYDQLFLIFKKKVYEIGWKLSEEKIKDTWFKEKMDYFKFYGRDIETLLAKVKIAHGRRVFCLPKDKKMIISLKDMNKGFDMFLNNNEVKERKNDHKEVLSHMYV